MAQNTLVDEQIRAGRGLLTELHRVTFPVVVAGWLKPTEEFVWHLYIGTPRASGRGLLEAYGLVRECLGRVPYAELIDPAVKLHPAADPTIREMTAIRDWLRPTRTLTYCGPRMLGSLAVDELILYPPAGVMTPNEVVQAVAALMNRTGAVAPSQFRLTNGQTLSAVPVGIDMRYPEGGVSFKLLNTATGQTEPHAVADIVDVG